MYTCPHHRYRVAWFLKKHMLKESDFFLPPLDPVIDAEIIAGCVQYGLEVVTPDS
jgi:hypothetical protein